jgi:hypothetical protein
MVAAAGIYCLFIQYSFSSAMAPLHDPREQDPGVEHAADYKRIEWQSSWGAVCIEVRGEQVWVNGKLVQPASQLDAKAVD